MSMWKNEPVVSRQAWKAGRQACECHGHECGQCGLGQAEGLEERGSNACAISIMAVQLAGSSVAACEQIS